MCLAEPLKVVEVEDGMARVNVGGSVKTVDASLIQDLRRGDYILLHGTLAIQKLDKEDAEETLKLIKQVHH